MYLLFLWKKVHTAWTMGWDLLLSELNKEALYRDESSSAPIFTKTCVLILCSVLSILWKNEVIWMKIGRSRAIFIFYECIDYYRIILYTEVSFFGFKLGQNFFSIKSCYFMRAQEDLSALRYTANLSFNSFISVFFLGKFWG